MVMGNWDDKFTRAERKWQSWRMQDYVGSERTIPHILQDKARRHPNRTVFRFRERGITFDELNQSTNSVANALSSLGLKQGDKLGMMLGNCPEFLFSWFGCNKIGAVSVPVNVAQRGDGLAYQLDQTDCLALVIEAGYLGHLETIMERLSGIRHVIVTHRADDQALPDWPGTVFLDFSALLSWPATSPALVVSHKDLSSILFTSGTTGRSKGVMIGHNYWYEIWSEAVKYGRLTEDDILYTGMPFFHAGAAGTTIGPTLLADAQAVLVERFSASRMLDDCRAYNCSEAKFTGSILPILMKQPERPDDHDNPVRQMTGAAAPPAMLQAFQQRYNTRLLEVYGMTECTVVLVNPFDARRPGSCGKPITGWSVKVVDDDDNEVPARAIGEIVAQPTRPYLGTSGYYKEPEATLELFRNFWIHTGDLGRQDDDGYFYFVDRKKQALRRRGENISSFEVEATINTHPSVAECCVVGVPSELAEDDVKLVLVLQDGARLDPVEFIEWCVPRLAYFAVPRYVAIRPELPKTATGRIEKYRLKAEGITPDCWDREAAGIAVRR